jgi:hypothetical protein
VYQKLTSEQGAYNLLWAIRAPRDNIKRGVFHDPVGDLSSMQTKTRRNPELEGELWARTEKELTPCW